MDRGDLPVNFVWLRSQRDKWPRAGNTQETGGSSIAARRGRSLTWEFRCVKDRKADPITGPGIAAAATWSKEVRMRCDRLAGARLAWQYARSTMSSARRPRARVRGSGMATWATLTRLGWKFNSAVEFVTEEGEVMNLLDNSPIKVRKRLEEAVDRWCITKGLEPLGCNGEEMVDKVEWKRAKEALHRMPLSKQKKEDSRQPWMVRHGQKPACLRQGTYYRANAHASTTSDIRRTGCSGAAFTRTIGKRCWRGPWGRQESRSRMKD